MRKFLSVLFISLGLLLLSSQVVAQDIVHVIPFEQDLCAIDPFHIEGQTHSLIGMGKPKDIFAKQQPDVSDQAVDPTPLDLETLGLSKSSEGEPSEALLVLIVDDFTTPTPLGVPHGQYVVSEFNKLLANSKIPFTLAMIDIATSGTGVDAYTASSIATQINDALQNSKEKRVVVNMSFAFVPCVSSGQNFDFRNFEFALSDANQTLENYVGNDAAASLFKDAAELKSPDNNPLWQYFFQGYSEAGIDQLFAIASAGNYGDLQTDPLAPASWTNVVAVSVAVNDDMSVHEWTTPTGEMSISNTGDVMVNGGWYTLDDLDGNGRADRGIGTSFAAPVVSVVAANYLAYSGSTAANLLPMFEFCSTTNGRYDYYPLPDVIQGSC